MTPQTKLQPLDARVLTMPAYRFAHATAAQLQEMPVKATLPARSFVAPLRRSSGFSLIELMVTVAIVAILAALAYPSYRNYVIRGQLVDGTNALAALRANMERYFQDNRAYSAANGFSPPCSPPNAPYTVGNFTLSCPTPPPVVVAPAIPTYTATAAGTGPLLGFTFFVREDGTQWSSAIAPAPAAWINNCPSTWMTKAGSC